MVKRKTCGKGQHNKDQLLCVFKEHTQSSISRQTLQTVTSDTHATPTVFKPQLSRNTEDAGSSYHHQIQATLLPINTS